MCPMCMTSAAIIAAGGASGAGILGLLVVKLRSLRRSGRFDLAQPGDSTSNKPRELTG